MKIAPFGKRILVRPVVKEQVLVSDDGTLNEYGEVIAIGPAVQYIKIGDKIGFSVFGVEKLVIGEEKHYLILEDEEFLLATLTEDEPV